MNRSKIIMFGCHLTGHGIETISQMLEDWENSPSVLMSKSKAENLPISGVSISVCEHWWRNTGTTLQGKPVKQCDRCGKTEC